MSLQTAHRSGVWRAAVRAAVPAAVVATVLSVLAAVFLAYQNPHLAVDLANRVWSCF